MNKPLSYVLCLSLFAGTLFLTMPRTALDVQVGDGADFAVAAVTGGLAHPPGFPVFTALADQWLKFWKGGAYASLASADAILQSSAAAALCLVAGLLSMQATVGAALALAWFLYPATLRGATDVEVFALHHVLCLVLVAVALTARRWQTPSTAAALGLAMGIACAHQPIVVLWTPLVLVCLLGTKPAGRMRRCVYFVGGAAFGLSPYLLLWSRYAAAPQLAFGDINTWDQWANYALRRGYGTFSFSAHAGETQSAALMLFKDVCLRIPALVLGLGVILARRLKLFGLPKANRRALGFELTLIAHGVFAALLYVPAGDDIEVAARFVPSILLAAALCLAVTLRSLSTVVCSVFVLALAVVPALMHAPEALDAADARQDTRTGFVLDEIFREAPANAVYFASTDTTIFGALLRQAVQNVRPDVDVVFVPRLAGKRYRAQMGARISAIAHVPLEARSDVGQLARAIMAAGRAVIADPIAVPAGLVRTPLGVVFAWNQSMPPATQTQAALLAFCSRLPDTLGDVSPARAQTQWIWRGGFTTPIVMTMRRIAHEGGAAKAPLLAGAQALLNGNIAAARQACANQNP